MRDVLRVRASGAEEVEETWRRYVPSARLNGTSIARLHFDWTSVSLPEFTFVDYEIDADLSSAVHPEDQIMACRVVTRTGTIDDDSGTLNASLPWVTTGSPVRARLTGRAQVRAFVLDNALAVRTARQVSGDDRLQLAVSSASPRSAAAAAHWERTYRHVGASFAALVADGESDAILEAELRRQAVVATLAAFSTSFVDSVERAAQTTAAPATVRRAIAYIETHAAQPITVDDIAQAARISTRGLQYAFRRALGISPMTYLRDVRLAAAHDELRRDPHPVVSQIARRWGFGSASRFAAFYRARYGVNPSQTARS
jgi:AraC-like DNA-binding protein